MDVNSTLDIALHLLPVMGLVIPGVAILVGLVIRRGYEAQAQMAGLISFCLVLVATFLNILFVVFQHYPVFKLSVVFFLVSLVALITSVVILVVGSARRRE